MHVVMTTVGTAGDIHPAIALGRTLQSRGHTTDICAYSFYESKVRSEGIGFRATAPNLTKEAISAFSLAIQATNDIRKQMLVMRDMLLAQADQRIQDCSLAIETADVVLCHHLDFPAT